MGVVFQAEYDKQARRVLARHWPDVHRYEDVHDVRDTAPVDVICGGFPCQDYSVAGKRGGLAGDRGALWWEMQRIIAKCRPTWVVGENVLGLLSSNGGRDFRTIVNSLVQVGYGVCWTVLDSQYFGVAQRRRRLFIVGHSGGVPRPEVLALSEGLFGHPAPSREAGEAVTQGVAQGVAGPYWDGGHISDTLDVSMLVKGQMMPEKRRFPVVHTHAPAIAFNIYPSSGQGSVLEASPTDVSNALNPTQLAAKTERGTRVLSPIPRRLTPLECERLQGFPDGWTEFYADGSRVADGPRYRMMGNAVTVNVAEWIGRRIMQAENEDKAEGGDA